MFYRSLIAAGMLAAMAMPGGDTWALDNGKFPDWAGAWGRLIVPGLPRQQPSHDQTKPWGFGQEAPLTPESTAILEASIEDQQKGGQGNYLIGLCLPAGMPQMMMAWRPLEFVITPATTYILLASDDHLRRIFTDGRDWPKDLVPTFAGYSIGKWTDEDGDGRFDMLEVETRGFKGPRSIDTPGLPVHPDNQSIFKERLYRDKADPNIIHDELTTIDHAFIRPWTVDKRYVREPEPYLQWTEYYCTENNPRVRIGKEIYFMSADGLLMPVHKDQPSPDLRYFKKTKK